MTEGGTAAAPPASRRKPRRKRNANKKNEKPKPKKSGGNGGNSGPPPPPQIKITIRNIQNSEKFGTVKSVLEGLVSKLMESCVEKKANNQYNIELDRAAIRHLITEEEKVEERRQRLLREKAKRDEESKEENPAEDGGAGEIEESKEDEGVVDVEMKDAGDTKDTLAADDNKLEVIVAPKSESNLPTITARPSYVVPPKKTKRRGERGGTAYVLLIGPKIEKKQDPPPPPTEPEEKKPSEEEKTADEESGEVPAAESKEESPADAVPETKTVPEKVINYPQELAKGRLLLSNAIKALIELVNEDTKSQEYAFSGCIVEHSMNGKTWKIFPTNNSRPDRREGTIENTADFKEWLEKTANQKEELKSRPKPVPGGGMAAATSTSDEVLEEDGQPVSSLVQHLRAKKLDAKRKKSQKKKKKEENNKKANAAAKEATTDDKKKKRNAKKNGKNNNTANGKKTDAAAAAAAKKAKRKKKERAKKKEKAKAAAAAGVGAKPPVLLKPQASAT